MQTYIYACIHIYMGQGVNVRILGTYTYVYIYIYMYTYLHGARCEREISWHLLQLAEPTVNILKHQLAIVRSDSARWRAV